MRSFLVGQLAIVTHWLSDWSTNAHLKPVDTLSFTLFLKFTVEVNIAEVNTTVSYNTVILSF